MFGHGKSPFDPDTALLPMTSLLDPHAMLSGFSLEPANHNGPDECRPRRPSDRFGLEGYH